MIVNSTTLICTECTKSFHRKHTSKKTKNVFCSTSCAAKYNNKHYPKKPKINICTCGAFSRSRRCQKCFVAEKILKYGNTTKGELFNRRKNYQSARTTIRKHAQAIFTAHKKSKSCIICGYKNYTEICHIKQVKEFDDSATLSEINHIDNLISLCPNHHWELDNKILQLPL